MDAVVGQLAEASNTEPLTSHLERIVNDGGCVETGGQVEDTCEVAGGPTEAMYKN